MRRDAPEGKVEGLGGLLLVLRIAHNHVSAFPAEAGDDALETRLFAYLKSRKVSDASAHHVPNDSMAHLF